MASFTGQNIAFILGLPRSGTTLLSAMLANHPHVCCPPEPWLLLALHSLGKVSARHPAESHALGQAVRDFIPDSIALARVAAGQAYAARLAPGQRLFVDKTPRYFHILPYLADLLPDAKRIHLDRNPLAVAASYKSTWAIDIADAIRSRRDSIAVIDLLVGSQRLASMPDSPSLCRVRYEDLVADPAAQIARIADFLGLPAADVDLTDLSVTAPVLARGYAGDKKIAATTRPHTASRDAWTQALSPADAKLLIESVGVAHFRSAGYADVVEQVAALAGPIDESAGQATRAWAAGLLEMRWTDIDYLSAAAPASEAEGEVESPILRRDRVAAMDATIAAQSARLADADAQAKSLAADADALRAQLADSAAALADAGNRVDAAAAELETHRAALARSRAQLSEAQGLLTDALTREHDTARQVGKLQAELIAVRKAADRIAQLESQLAAALDASQRLHNDHAAADQRLAAESQAHAATALRVQQQAEHIASLRVELDTAQRERNAAASLAASAEQRLYGELTLSFRERIKRDFKQLAKGLAFGRYGRRPREYPLPSMTIVTPAYNSADTIRHTIQTVLAQNYPNLQYIIVDGGSTDATADIAREYLGRGVSQVISEPDNGMYDAVAKGLALATGEILSYINADDLYEPGGLLRVGQYFAHHPHAKVIHHEDTVTLDGWRFPNNRQRRADHIAILKGMILYQDGVFFRRSAYHGVGGFNRIIKRAGDWEMWARLSRPFKFIKRPGHVSSFVIRKGQLSQDLNAYYAEIEAARPALQASLGLAGKVWQNLRHLGNRVRNFLANKFTRDRLFFALNKSGAFCGYDPQPGRTPPFVPNAPQCPVSGRAPDTFLFSTRDTRFGDDLINYVYYDSQSHTAISYPPLNKEQLNVLYETYYSKPHTQVIPPAPGKFSPYQNYRGGTLLDRLALKILLPRVFQRGMHWTDNTLGELLKSIGKREFPKRGKQIRFLDVGCFEGALLDRVKAETDWVTCGVEPNSNAAAICQNKGHQVWCGYADDAPFVVPKGETFDLIYLGQVIEHLNNPLEVVRRLRTLLKPGGVLVMSTPNLDSKQIDLFGPTWSHWHLPYHRFLFSKKSLTEMARLANLQTVRVKCFSHPYWTCLSLKLNELGIGAVVSHAIDFSKEPHIAIRAGSLTGWARILWNWRGKGDYLFAVLRNPDR